MGRLGVVSSKLFDLLNSMMYDLKRFLGLRWWIDPVRHSLDDLVYQNVTQNSLAFFKIPKKWLPKSKRKGRSGGSSCRAALPWLKGSATTASTSMHLNISLCTGCSIFIYFYRLFVYIVSLLEYTSIYLCVLCFFFEVHLNVYLCTFCTSMYPCP